MADDFGFDKQWLYNLRFKINSANRELLNHVADVGEGIPRIIRNRVINTGEDHRGFWFTPYSSKSHIKKRRRRGLNTSFKDFNFSGSMWDSLRVIRKTVWQGGAMFEIGFSGTNAEADGSRNRPARSNRQLAVYHSQREGTLIHDLSPDETERIYRILNQKIQEFLRDVIR